MTRARQQLGRRAEELAAARLRRSGWRILDRNFRTRAGELDLVALDGDVVVFVEVKAGRLGARAGPERPALAVGRRKQLQVRRLAREWLASADGPRPSWVGGYRFDVVGITYDGTRAIDLEHIRDAF